MGRYKYVADATKKCKCRLTQENGLEPERSSGMDHIARHREGLALGHRHGRQTIAYVESGPGRFKWNLGGGFLGATRRTLRLYFHILGSKRKALAAEIRSLFTSRCAGLRMMFVSDGIIADGTSSSAEAPIRNQRSPTRIDALVGGSLRQPFGFPPSCAKAISVGIETSK